MIDAPRSTLPANAMRDLAQAAALLVSACEEGRAAQAKALIAALEAEGHG